ncbi:MAG TPA: methyl-accepting chemotaxis protein [Opitutus sp.]|nr:methyl-accepting chemotaxis protein [Opitutus sp.]
MKNWTIRKRIITGFAVILVLVCIQAIATRLLLRPVVARSDEIENKLLPSLTLISEVKSNIGEIQIRVVRTLLAEDPVELKRIIDETEAMRARNLELIELYAKTITDEEDRGFYTSLKENLTHYAAARQQLFSLLLSGQRAEANAWNLSAVRPAYEAYQADASRLLTHNIATATAAVDASGKDIRKTDLITVVSATAAIGLGIVFATAIVIGLSRLLGRVASALEDSAAQVAAAAGQVSSASQTLASGSSEQAASLEETSASLEEMSSMAKRNAASAAEAKDLSSETRGAADAGQTDMQEMSQAVAAIKQSSDGIAKIVKTIDEIAFQTNILALNAAVEAARAGEAGMGFAVVAEEVRNLAHRSAQSAKETAVMIEESVRRSEHGVAISEKVAQSLTGIVARAHKMDGLVAEIAQASGEQTQGIGQVNSAVAQMDRVTQSNAGTAEETAAAAEELSAQSHALREHVAELTRLAGVRGSVRELKTSAPVPPAKPGKKSKREMTAVTLRTPSEAHPDLAPVA